MEIQAAPLEPEPLRVVIEECAIHNNEYHFRSLLNASDDSVKVTWSNYNQLTGNSKGTLSLDEPARDLVIRCFGIEGIISITVHTYHLDVYIGKAYDWKDITPMLLDRVRSCFNQPLEIKIRPDRTKPELRDYQPDRIAISAEASDLVGESAEDKSQPINFTPTDWHSS